MPGSLKHKLQHFEVTPPPAAWHNISKRLDEEPVAHDIALSLKLESLDIQPPVSAWDDIQSSISGNSPVILSNPRNPVALRRIAIAAAVLGALIIGALFFFTGNNDQQVVSDVEVSDVISPSPVGPPATAPDTSDVTVSAPAERPNSVNPPQATSPSRTVRSGLPSVKNRSLASQNAPPIDYEAEYVNDIEEARLPQPQVVAALQPIAVSAPPIRDAKGNIIMDLDVISEPGRQYIIVTGPNGNQTRISSKFINCLRYLNGNLSSFGRDRDAVECRRMFDEWRNKFLSEGAFIPAADNFFDIFELKEMIQD